MSRQKSKCPMYSLHGVSIVSALSANIRCTVIRAETGISF